MSLVAGRHQWQLPGGPWHPPLWGCANVTEWQLGSGNSSSRRCISSSSKSSSSSASTSTSSTSSSRRRRLGHSASTKRRKKIVVGSGVVGMMEVLAIAGVVVTVEKREGVRGRTQCLPRNANQV